jgi:hypothetical protein
MSDNYDWNRDGLPLGDSRDLRAQPFPIPKWGPLPKHPPMTPLRYGLTMLVCSAVGMASIAFLPTTGDIVKNAISPGSYTLPSDGTILVALFALAASVISGMISYWRRLADIGFTGWARRLLFGIGWFIVWPLPFVAIFIPTGAAAKIRTAVSQIRLKPILLVAAAIGACIAAWVFVIEPAIHFHALSVACSSNTSGISARACSELTRY